MLVAVLSCLNSGLYVTSRALFGRASEPLHRFAERDPAATQDDLELHVLKVIEPLRLVSRIAPMLGLVATMIPMGPALIAVSAGNAQGMAESLVVAFSAVIVALLAAAMTYAALCIRRRWLLSEMNVILNRRGVPRVQDAPGSAPLAGAVHG